MISVLVHYTEDLHSRALHRATTAIGIGTRDFRSILCINNSKLSSDTSRRVAYEDFSAGVAIFQPKTWRKTLANENYTNFRDDGVTGRHMQIRGLKRNNGIRITEILFLE